MPTNPSEADSSALQMTSGGMGFEAFISDPLGAIDAPEPTLASSRFVYNYFTPNEKLAYEGGSGYAQHTGAGALALESTPMYIQLTFKPPAATNQLTEGQARSLLGGDLLTLISQGYLNFEESVTSEKFSRVQISPDQVDVRLSSVISSLGVTLSPEEVQAPRSFSEMGRHAASLMSGVRGEASAGDADVVLSNQEIGQAIVKYINSSGQSKGFGYTSQIERKVLERNDIITRRQETLSINRIVYDRILRASTCNTNNIFVDAISDFLDDSRAIQRSAVASSIAAGISADVHEMTIRPYRIAPGTSRNRSFLVGYMIEKMEVRRDDIVTHPTLLIYNTSSPIINDTSVNYASIFRYRVRSIFVREMQVMQEGTNESAVGYVLVASSGESAETSVVCEELVPPPEIADFRVTYDFQARANRLDWSLPVNRQRDIKYFQVFKRRSVTSPFRLVRVIDFDDSTIRSTMPERYPDSVVTRAPVPLCVFIDEASSEDREEIYTVCAIDAHGLSSGYSTQIGATFRTSRNALSVRTVSRPGAPKTYPNLYIAEDAFADAVRISDKRSLYTLFDPEAIEIQTGESGAEMLHNVAGRSTFTISIINEESALGASVTLRSAESLIGDVLRTSNITGDPDEVILTDMPALSGRSFT